MDLSEFERLVQIVQNADIREITIRQGESRITVRKHLQAPETGSALAVVDDESWEEAVLVESGSSPPDDEKSPGHTVVTAPAVGVFHHVKPHVGIAAIVTEGQIIGQIEALRLLNEVVAPTSGQIEDVLVEDGMAVEYGQSLYVIGPLPAS